MRGTSYLCLYRVNQFTRWLPQISCSERCHDQLIYCISYKIISFKIVAIISLSRFASAYDDHFLLLLLFFHHKTTLLGSWKKNLNKRTFFCYTQRLQIFKSTFIKTSRLINTKTAITLLMFGFSRDFLVILLHKLISILSSSGSTLHAWIREGVRTLSPGEFKFLKFTRNVFKHFYCFQEEHILHAGNRGTWGSDLFPGKIQIC